MVNVTSVRANNNDQYIEGLGWISRNGKNFLPSIVRLEEILSGKMKCPQH